jgi:hypothetical protein
MIFKLLDVTKETARIWSDTILKNLPDCPNYTGIEPPDRYYLGFLGEITFRDALWYHGKRWHYQARLDGRPDQTDLTVWMRGVRKQLNVKTASKEFHRHLMVPDAQFRRYTQDYYVAARLIDNHGAVVFEGWLKHADLERRQPQMVDVMTRCCPFTELRPMVFLMMMIDRESVDRNAHD